ncbi:MAG: hypothetical protein R3C97_03065 [Geminicoccaceae bacterium]
MIFHETGWLDVAFGRWLEASTEIRARLVASSIRAVTGVGAPLRRDAIDRLIAGLAEKDGRGTLGHAIFTRQGERLRIMRETRHLPAPVELAGERELLWDNRFFIRFGEKNVPFFIAPAGADCVSRLPKKLRRKGEIPSTALLGMPALRQKGCDEWQHMLAIGEAGELKWSFHPARAFTGVSFMH